MRDPPHRLFARTNLVWVFGVAAGVIAGGIVAYGLTATAPRPAAVTRS